jgi:putative transposase
MGLFDVSRTAIEKRARRESWRSQPRPGRGGGNEWLLESMPEHTRLTIAAALISQQSRELDAERRKQSVNTSAPLAKMPTSARDRAEARAAVTSLAERFAAAHSNLKRSSAYELFAIQYNAGEINAPTWAREVLPHVCRASLKNWADILSSEGAGALAGNYGTHRKGTGAMDQPYIAEYCIGHIYKKPHVTASGIYKDLEARLTLKNRPEKCRPSAACRIGTRNGVRKMRNCLPT